MAVLALDRMVDLGLSETRVQWSSGGLRQSGHRRLGINQLGLMLPGDLIDVVAVCGRCRIRLMQMSDRVGRESAIGLFSQKLKRISLFGALSP